MSQDPLDPFLFRLGVFFTKGGEFKFGTADGSWENMYKAAHANAPYTDPEVEFIKGFDPDNKWVLNAAETNLAYKICLDIRPGAERMLMTLFTPYTEMYMVGDATPNGWDLGNATPMTQDASDPNIFTWSGHLNAGEMKFSPRQAGRLERSMVPCRIRWRGPPRAQPRKSSSSTRATTGVRNSTRTSRLAVSTSNGA